MSRLLYVLALGSLPLLLGLSVALNMVTVGSAQTGTCAGQNRCETFVSNGGTTQCAILGCSQSTNQADCNFQRCVLIPSSCGPGSGYDGPMTCAPTNLSASTSYYCAATDQSVIRVVVGPGLCGAAPSPTPTPSPSPTPCTAQPGDICLDSSDCCWNQGCNTNNRCYYLLIAGNCNGPADWVTYPSTGCITGLFFQGPCTRTAAFRSKCDEYEDETCSCTGGFMSPIVIDVDGSGFSMTDVTGGVVFNFLNDGVPLALSWTAPASTNAFLVLDRNGNGTIDNGEELFGDVTPQPPSSEPNGFLALAVYDTAAGGGNGNGRIDSGDAIFSQLRLWQDVNHNAISEPNELRTATALGITGIDLNYKESKKTDAHGNNFRYRAKVFDVNGTHAGRWAWDVFLKFQ
jgi:hypothetical protein